MALKVDIDAARKFFNVFAPVIAVAVVLPVFFVKDYSPKNLTIYSALIILYLFPLFVAKRRHFVEGAKPEKVLGSMIGVVIYGLFVLYHDFIYLYGYVESDTHRLMFMPFFGVVFWVMIYWIVVLVFTKMDFAKKL